MDDKETTSEPQEQSPTRYKALPSLVICEGGACKRNVSRDELLSAWKKDYLWQASHLSFSDCMEPCDLASNAWVLSEAGVVWLSSLEVDEFTTLPRWVLACKREIELPVSLQTKQIARYETPNVMTLEGKQP